jgi:hypothetical protein
MACHIPDHRRLVPGGQSGHWGASGGGQQQQRKQLLPTGCFAEAELNNIDIKSSDIRGGQETFSQNSPTSRVV